jgi:hypothetical protein
VPNRLADITSRQGLRRRAHRGAAAAALTVLLACGSGSELPEPNLGQVTVVTRTTGSDVDADGYAITVDDGEARPVSVTDSLQSEDLLPGDHAITVSGVAENCAVAGSNPRNVTLLVGSSVRVDFDVACSAVSSPGSLDVTVSTTGAEPDDDGYVLFLDPAVRLALPAHGTATLTGLSPGTHALRLAGVASNCTAAATNPTQVAIASQETAQVALVVECAPGPLGLIAFVRTTGEFFEQSDVYLINADGTDLRLLRRNAGLVAWSPDGGRLALATGTSVVVIDPSAPEGGVDLQGCIPGGSGVWSSDGRLLCLTDFPIPEAPPSLYAIRADGTGRVDFLPDTVKALSGSWGREGRVVFRCVSAVPGEFQGICTIRSDGTGLAKVVDFGPDDPDLRIDTGTPVWSPDGTRIAFRRSVCENDFVCSVNAILVMNADGSGLRPITSDVEQPLGDPVWSPDGGRLAFSSQDLIDAGRFNLQIFITAPDGSARTRVTGPGSGFDPSWSPDGAKLVFTGHSATDPEDDDFADIFVVNANGTNLLSLTRSVGVVGNMDPAWRP